MPLVVAAAIAAAGTAYAANQQKQAAKKAAEGGAPVDIQSLDLQARQLSKRNVADSIALEKQYTPEVEALRRQATESLLPYTTGADTARDQLRTELYGDFQKAGNNPLARSSLLDDAIAKARADLALGGTLDTATRNEVARAAGANAASVGGGRLGLGRDISARDLGLKSLDLQNQRLSAASALGGQDQATLQAQAAQDAANAQRRMSTASLLSDLQGQTFAQRLGLAQFGQSIARPQTGLDPTSLVNLRVGNTNAANAANQQQAAIQAQTGNSIMQGSGQLAGTIGSLYSQYGSKSSTAPQGTFVAGDNGGYKDENILGTYYIPRK